MENITSPGFETLEEYSPTNLAEDDLLPENLLEEEYAIWEEGVSFLTTKNRTEGISRVFEDEELGMPAEESLHYLAECFTLKTFPNLKKHY